MIIITYPGINKRELLRNDLDFINLQCEDFWVNGKEIDDWHIAYCQVAEDLSRQGYTVFVFSHDMVRQELKKSSEKVIYCIPQLKLKEEWIKQLSHRWETYGLDKDYRTYLHVSSHYTEDINSILKDGFDGILIDSMNYDLKKLISNYQDYSRLEEEDKDF